MKKLVISLAIFITAIISNAQDQKENQSIKCHFRIWGQADLLNYDESVILEIDKNGYTKKHTFSVKSETDREFKAKFEYRRSGLHPNLVVINDVEFYEGNEALYSGRVPYGGFIIEDFTTFNIFLPNAVSANSRMDLTCFPL